MFDPATDRCYDCDGKLRHFQGCADYAGEPVLTVEERVFVQSLISGIDSLRSRPA